MDETRRTPLYSEQECDAIVRKYTFPIKTKLRALYLDMTKVVLRLENGIIVVFERQCPKLLLFSLETKSMIDQVPSTDLADHERM